MMIQLFLREPQMGTVSEITPYKNLKTHGIQMKKLSNWECDGSIL